ncbi:hypothetical protein DMENIID0001_114020 [Sergentomyia squamirostris]
MENFKLHLMFQKFISIPQYDLPRTKSRRYVLLFIRLIPWSILVVFDVFMIPNPSSYILDTQDINTYVILEDFTIAVMILDAIVARLGMILLVMFIFSKSQQHIQVIKHLMKFEKLPGRRSVVKSRRFTVELILVACNQYIFISLTYPFVASMHVYALSLLYITQTIFFDLMVIYMIHIIRHFSELLEKLPLRVSSPHGLTNLTQLVDEANNILRMFNQCFNAIIPLMILRNFFDGCHGLFITYSLIVSLNMTLSNICQGIGNIAWTLKNFSFIAYMSFSSFQLHVKIARTSRTVSRIQMTDDIAVQMSSLGLQRHLSDEAKGKQSLYFNAQRFLLGSFHQPTKVSAGGFFDLDNSVIYTVFSSVISYIVILVQFKQLEEEIGRQGSI